MESNTAFIPAQYLSSETPFHHSLISASTSLSDVLTHPPIFSLSPFSTSLFLYLPSLSPSSPTSLLYLLPPLPPLFHLPPPLCNFSISLFHLHLTPSPFSPSLPLFDLLSLFSYPTLMSRLHPPSSSLPVSLFLPRSLTRLSPPILRIFPSLFPSDLYTLR